MAIFNAVVRTVLLAFVAPRSLILTGVLVLVLQVVAFLVVAQWSPGVHVDGFLTALIGSFVYAIINTILTSILGVDRGRLVLRAAHPDSSSSSERGPQSDQPGLVIVQIDGLAYPILAGRIRAGSVNTMTGWVRDKSHKLSRWEAILPSMTSASQAGILHGTNDGIPAFRWYERDREHLMVSSNPNDAAEIVRRLSNGAGAPVEQRREHLQPDDGRRDASLSHDVGDQGRVARGSATARPSSGFFFSPTGYLRSFTLFLAEFVQGAVSRRGRPGRSGVTPQMHRGSEVRRDAGGQQRPPA